ncbi:Asp23/Gls24 family envelope stress response protein [Rhodococcus chondri]|uniref:Alkaline shock response membrane anchor protein AmaP n=1 Tax=Rhodococcus chondri TaxID=3065941 RepID=A0ABU7JTE0_9NOCA|nr:hypothetical protein [Rhodococcus sp. CC-R104]MEE2033289.1 hypothetical protein [Rhodococcus sp. CC-R104]
MKLRSVLVNRFIAFAVGAALLGAGAFSLAWVWQVPFARAWLARLDRPRVMDVPDQPWWTAALWTAFATGLTIGIVLLVVNLSRRRTSTVQLYDEVTDATLAVELGPVADGVAGELAGLPGVRSARGRAVVERHLPTLSVIVHAEPGLDVAEFTARAEETAQRAAGALGGAPVATQVLLHLDPAGEMH